MTNQEINKLVAEKIFNWKRWKFQNPSRTPGVIAFEYETLVPPEYDGTDLQHLSMTIPDYSSDISTAWRVVEKLIELGFYPAIWVKPGIVQIYDHDEKIIAEEKEAIPLAVCLAALKAVGAL